MSTSTIRLADGTVTFLPHRLNRQSVVVRGLTADELWICVSLSGFIGLLLGSLVAWAGRSIALLPTCIVAAVAMGVFTGGGLLRRLKRGRPDTWLHRYLHSWAVQQYPRLAQRLGFLTLVQRSGCWSTRRGRP
ncbi:TIGR03750 family conjugal transfer protein [Pseudomonas fluorescens]|uniref:TIGR03750 family conjugal transfer protein n=1 Tax=Pseudomonas fluorescens TaxID=294 RepID=UPI001BEAD7F5|nr:TIGR03750 family conjugal transfer protein [Pseudomonas fluorescens]MBT2375329.1 TIGR03750 family conjugal transfer protein [Pseudomonas fluorescens]